MAELGVFAQARRDVASQQDGDEMLPMPKITELIMRGNAQAQGETMARDLSDKHTEAMGKISFTLKPNPRGGEPLVTIKDAPLSAINRTHEDEVGKALTEPTKAVERKLAEPTPEQQVANERMFDANDATYGKRLPRPADVDELLSTPEGIQELTFALGGNRDHAKRYAKEAKDPSRRAELAAKARHKLIEMHTGIFKESKVALDESQDIDQNARASEGAARAAATEDRLVRDQRLRVRNQLLDQTNTMQFGSADEYLAAAESSMVDVGGFRAGDREQFASAYRTNRAKVLGDRVKALSGEEGKRAIEGYQDTPEDMQRFIDDQIGVANLSEWERNRVTKIAKGLFEFKSDMQRKESQQIAAESRREALAVRQTVASERAAAEAARKNRVEERAADREQRLTREKAVGAITKRMEDLADTINRNSLKAADAANTTPQERAELARQNAIMVQELKAKGDELRAQITFVSQSEYDALVAAGETPTSIAADGIRVRKGKK